MTLPPLLSQSHPSPVVSSSAKWLAIGAACAVVAVAGLALAPAAVARRCVGVFVSGERGSIAADTKGLVVVGSAPCPNGVIAWSRQGVYRAFDDGAVEFLATPVPPCPDGDGYVWIRYPNP